MLVASKHREQHQLAVAEELRDLEKVVRVRSSQTRGKGEARIETTEPCNLSFLVLVGRVKERALEQLLARGWPVTLPGKEVVGPEVLPRFDQALATLGHGVPRDLNSSCLSPRKDSLRQVNGNASKRGCHADGYRRASEGCECEPSADSGGAACDGRPPLNNLVSATRDVGLILAPASHQPSFSDQDAYAQARSEAEDWLLELTLEWARARNADGADVRWSDAGVYVTAECMLAAD